MVWSSGSLHGCPHSRSSGGTQRVRTYLALLRLSATSESPRAFHAPRRLGTALEREPNHATAWACLSDVCLLEYFDLDGFNPREKPLERARDAAWRAVKIDAACQMFWKELAAVHFFSRDFATFRETAERAMSQSAGRRHLGLYGDHNYVLR